MERGPIVNDYFQLRDYLNRANKLSNKMTKVTFEIQEIELFKYRLFAIARGQNESHKITLAERSAIRVWERAGYTRFQNLEIFCATTLNRHEDRMRIGRRPRRLLPIQTKVLQDAVSRVLEQLLLNPGYEP